MKFFKPYIRKNGLSRHPKAMFLALGAALFSLGVVTSVATTYAWYALNVLWELPNLDVKIITEQELGFSFKMDLEQKEGAIIRYEDRINEEGMFTGFTLEDMEYDKKTGLNDVSGMYQDEWFKNADPLTTRPQFRSHYGATPGSANPVPGVATQGYLQTVLWLTASEDCEIYLSKIVETNDDGIEKEVPVIKSVDTDERLQKVVNTVRLSFYSDDGYKIAYQEESGKLKTTYYGGPLDMNGDGYYDSFEGREVFYGEYENPEAVNSLYRASNGGEQAYPSDMRDVFHANHADVAYLDYDRSNPDPAINVKAEDSHNIYEYIYDEDEPLRPLSRITRLTANEPKRLVLSVYCEGWDLDMTDAINHASFNINIGFTALLKTSY